MAEITVQHLRKEFTGFTAVARSSFTIADGEFFMLLGPSGCGKTTTLRMIAGLEFPTAGRITIAGQDVTNQPASRRDIAMVFQMFALYPHMTVRRNIAYPLVSQGVARREIGPRVEEVARILGIADILDRGVGGLSGGDRQRVALARAIVRRPQAFMMDEPLGALDAEFRERMAEELRALHDRIGATTVYVTHDQLEAMQMGDRIAVMNKGLIEQIGRPQEIYDHPASMFVADFIGSPPMNFLPIARPVGDGAQEVRVDQTQVPVPRVDRSSTGEHVLGIRPEDVILTDRDGIAGEVVASDYLGTTRIVTVRTNSGHVKARVPSGQGVTPGETLRLRFEARRLAVFDRATGRALRTAANLGVNHG